MRIIKKHPKELTFDDYLIAKLKYKKQMVLMNENEIVYEDYRWLNEKIIHSQSISYNSPHLFITTDNIFVLTAKEGYLIIDYLDNRPIYQYEIVSRNKLIEIFKEQENTIFIYNNIISKEIKVPTNEEILTSYKKEVSNYLLNSEYVTEREKDSFDEYYNKNLDKQITYTINKLINKIEIDDIAEGYQILKETNDIIICKSLENGFEIKLVQVFFINSNTYKLVTKNIPIKTYKEKDLSKAKKLHLQF